MPRGLGLLLMLLPTLAWAQVDPVVFAPFEDKPVTEIRIDGNRVTRDYVILRELEAKAGEPFHAAALEADLQRLENLGIFAETSVAPEADAELCG